MTAQRIPVLMYHRIGEQTSGWDRHYSVTPAAFAAQMRGLARHGYRACTLSGFLDWLDERTELPESSFLITFDDGFSGVVDHALPVLSGLGWSATVFMVSRRMGGPADWARTSGPDDRSRRLMDEAELRLLMNAGWAVQSHGRHHRDFTQLDEGGLDDELSGSRGDLAALTGRVVDVLAYPFGRHDDTVTTRVRQAGYRAAFSVQPGFNRRDADRLALRRLDVFGTDTPTTLRRKLALGSNDGSLVQQLRYRARRVFARLRPAA
ncbi:polysaccharide deacetylase family protein [Methyloversatilis sp.]|uniref:polysaccharide deacetylase family protein n=1 Tax=Methyloversatilis sp. TaxID=2569862 RepID=UPI0035B0FFC2